MPGVYPLQPLQYTRAAGDLGTLIAPPYDVLDASSKSRLLTANPHNIVAVDLPHTPAKELGPSAAYADAANTLRDWINQRLLALASKPAIFVYRQTFQSSTGQSVQRTGVCCCVNARPFGEQHNNDSSSHPFSIRGAILPHEETFSGPKEDRFALMRETQTQLSPIFGLHPDERGDAARILRDITAATSPDIETSLGNVHQEIWTVTDADRIRAYQAALAEEDIFIADGHHRYTTQLNYIKHLETQTGHPLPTNHPARRCMMVLVSMSDPGLVIWPTHRVFGGMESYSLDRLLSVGTGVLGFEPAGNSLDSLSEALNKHANLPKPIVGLFDVKAERAFLASSCMPDPLSDRFSAKPAAWRNLDVAFVQHILAETICQPHFNHNKPIKWAFPHSLAEARALLSNEETSAGGGSGFNAQLVVLVRPTPLAAVREVSRANELMPQKSTFFYPKLATGLWLNPLA